MPLFGIPVKKELIEQYLSGNDAAVEDLRGMNISDGNEIGIEAIKCPVKIGCCKTIPINPESQE